MKMARRVTLTLLLYSPFLVEGQTIPLSEGLFDFTGASNQKVVRLSKRIVSSFNLSNEFLYSVYYNAARDQTFPRDQTIESVTWIYDDKILHETVHLPLWDDGLHFDGGAGDSIYGNFRVLGGSALDAQELILDVEGDSAGVRTSVLFPPVVVIPASPTVLFPWNEAVITGVTPVVHWQVDPQADGCVLFLMEAPFDFRRKLGTVLWQVEHRNPMATIVSDTVGVSLAQHKTYYLIAWSYVGAGFREGAYQNEAFSMEASSFRVSEPDSVSHTFSLNRIYPNPTQNAATVSWNQPLPEYVTLSVYDIVGREVKHLASQQMPAGEHAVVWDGTDSIGQKVPSGVYFLNVRSETAQQTARLVLVH
jgi:hypothetical protein